MGDDVREPKLEEVDVAQLARYLGGETAAALVAGRASDAELAQALASLTAMHHAVSTYLPRHVLVRQLAASDEGPWLTWLEGTLLLADVSGSTALAERLSVLGREGTEVITETLNRYFGTMIHLMSEAGGDLLTFGGDALLVFFEGPASVATATATGLTLLRELAGFVREVPGLGQFPLTMHIGLEAGAVALVSCGHPQARRYAVMGRTVTDVARAEHLAKQGELVVGPHAWSTLAPHAIGAPCTEGFVQLTALHLAPPLPFILPVPPQLPVLASAHLVTLARQLDQLTPYLPARLLERILAEPERPQVEADLRPVTILFAQISGMTTLIEALPPAEAAAVVDALVRPLQTVITGMGGFINKLDLATDGDKVMAVFGAPVADEDHAERAVRAALLMLGEGQALMMQTLALLTGYLQPELAQLRFRIGLNTGNVFAGNVGTATRKEYTVMGDAVNVAARVMAAAAWGEIRAVSVTAAMVSKALAFDDPQVVIVKGKREPLTLLRLVGEQELSENEALVLPLLGRDHEMAWLQGHLAAMRQGEGRAVRVLGEAGIGKSRLAAELLQQATAEGTRVLHIRCLAYNRVTPYLPWGKVVRDLCGITGRDDQAARAQKLGAMLARAGLLAEDWLPLMAELVRLEVDDNPILRTLDPGQRQVRRFEIVLALLQAAAWPEDMRQHELAGHTEVAIASEVTVPGLIVLLDNLQWADEVSLNLWQFLSTRLSHDPILLLGLHRGQLAWGTGEQGDHAEVRELGPLSEASGHALLTFLAFPERLSDDVQARLVARAAGNPLFLEELLRAVESMPDTLDALPDSLSGLLLARIDRLDEHSRTLLRVASVIGQRFPVDIVHSIYETDLDNLVRRLMQLDADELTATERERPERIHLFRHALLQEVAYQSLLYVRRRELHRRIAAYLEERYADELAEIRTAYGSGPVQIGRNGSVLNRVVREGDGTIFLLANHYRLSDTPAQAVNYLLLAGHIARDDSANDLAVQYYRWALEALGVQPADPRYWEAREALGDVLCTLGCYQEALAEYAMLLYGDPEARSGHGESRPGHATTAPGYTLPPAVEAEVLRSWGDALEKQGRYDEALARLREAEDICEQHLNEVPPLLLAAIYADMGQVLRRLSRFDQALDICKTGLSKIRSDRRSFEDERIEAELQQLMGSLYAMRGAYERARFHFSNALAAQEEVDDLYGRARSHNNLGYLAQLQSDYKQAVAHYREAEVLAHKISAKYILSSVLLNAAYGYYRLDRYAEAEEACRKAMALCREMGDEPGMAQADDTLGIIAYSRGQYDLAVDVYEHALAIYQAQHSAYQEGNTLALLSVCESARGEVERAYTLAEQALAIAQKIQVPQLEIEALNALAEASLLAVQHDEVPSEVAGNILVSAAQWARDAARLAERLGNKLDQGVALRLQGEIAACQGNAYDAYFAAALDLFTAASSTFERARTEARLGEALALDGDPAAQRHLTAARAIFAAIGATGELQRLAG